VVRAFENPVEEAYDATPALSIDYGIMEKTRRAAVVPLDADWNDLGNFDALYAVLPKSGDANAVRGEHIGIDSSRNLIVATAWSPPSASMTLPSSRQKTRSWSPPGTRPSG
jgi:mannose-1-phosphate guanylyltransferase/mannose-6-phosphate isomerase